MDWIDPNTWKPLAQLISSWQAIIGGIILIVGYITGFFRWVLKRLGWFQSRTKSTVEQKDISLIFVQNDLHCHWGVALLNKQPGTHVHGRWYVTNNSNRNVMILKARLDRHASRFAQVSMRHPDKRDYFSSYPVLSHRMSEVSVDLSFYPPIGQGHEPIIRDVIFTDNLGNEHRVRSQFSYLGSDKPF